MELLYSMRRKPLKCEPPHFESPTDTEVVRPICTVSICNIIAFSSPTELTDVEGDTWGGHVYVCDLDTPWDSHKVTSTSYPVSALEWDNEGKQLLVATTVGEVSVFGQKEYLLNEWACLYTASFPGEQIIKSSFFHNGRRVVAADKKPDAPITEKFQLMRTTPTLKGFGGIACEGAVIVTATGLVGSLTPPTEGTCAVAVTESLRPSREHVTAASIAHKNGNLLIAALCKSTAGWMVRVSVCTAASPPPALKPQPLPAVRLHLPTAPVSITWCLREDTDSLLIAGNALTLWKLTERSHSVHKLLAKGPMQGSTTPGGGPKPGTDSFNTVVWQQMAVWPIEGGASAVSVASNKLPLTPPYCLLATPRALHLIARDKHHYVSSRPVITSGTGAAEVPAGAGTPPKKPKYGPGLLPSGGARALVSCVEMCAAGGLAVLVDTHAQLHVYKLPQPWADIRESSPPQPTLVHCCLVAAGGLAVLVDTHAQLHVYKLPQPWADIRESSPPQPTLVHCCLVAAGGLAVLVDTHAQLHVYKLPQPWADIRESSPPQPTLVHCCLVAAGGLAVLVDTHAQLHVYKLPQPWADIRESSPPQPTLVHCCLVAAGGLAVLVDTHAQLHVYKLPQPWADIRESSPPQPTLVHCCLVAAGGLAVLVDTHAQLHVYKLPQPWADIRESSPPQPTLVHCCLVAAGGLAVLVDTHAQLHVYKLPQPWADIRESSPPQPTLVHCCLVAAGGLAVLVDTHAQLHVYKLPQPWADIRESSPPQPTLVHCCLVAAGGLAVLVDTHAQLHVYKLPQPWADIRESSPPQPTLVHCCLVAAGGLAVLVDTHAQLHVYKLPQPWADIRESSPPQPTLVHCCLVAAGGLAVLVDTHAQLHVYKLPQPWADIRESSPPQPTLVHCCLVAAGGLAVLVDTHAQLHVYKLPQPWADIPTPVAVQHACTLLEYSLVSGTDCLDLLMSLKPALIEPLYERLTETFQRQAPAFQQYYFHSWLKLRIALCRLHPSMAPLLSSVSCLQVLCAVWAAVCSAIRADDKPDAAAMDALLDDHHDQEKALLTLEAKPESCGDMSALSALRRPLQRSLDIALTALLASTHHHQTVQHGYDLLGDPTALTILRKLVVVARASGCGGETLSRPLARRALHTSKVDLQEECLSLAAQASSTRVWECLPRCAVSAPHGKQPPLFLEYCVEPEQLRYVPDPPAYAQCDTTPSLGMDSIRYMYLGGGWRGGRWRACSRCGARALPAAQPARHPLQRAHDARFLIACRCGGKWTLFSNVEI